ncbi:acetyl-coenzyme A synthetase, cytoplasmic-like isoform X2 [Lethenteron reissneri]|uniref:acetyl-coenzyme A synthetase, cytoplasmic-like isoform X2 n=1 Tax=Lethenteron reissneri TaxID=7753 RepID=UPI002AB7DFA4|nr:acetyl-coenzyme A synthetase, cytoplasmic-like isoform X2 [Lethenteron reissneri]
MDPDEVVPPPTALSRGAHVRSLGQYAELYARSIQQPSAGEFWKEIAREFHWERWPPQEDVLSYNFDVRRGRVFVEWFAGGLTNVCYNLLDRNVLQKGLGGRVAFYWEGNRPDESSQITYAELLAEVCKFSNVLLAKGVRKGDRVAVYLPMVLELVVAMLACARLGAVHSVVFAGFSADALHDRIADSQCRLLITADGFHRGDKSINLKEIADEALKKNAEEDDVKVEHCIVVRRLGEQQSGVASEAPVVPWTSGRDSWWHELMLGASTTCEPAWCDAEDPLFVLYTSGSTGKPKGVLHTTAGYLLFVATTHKLVFDIRPQDVYWCTADIGWITGHSYIVYGPLANGVTSVLFEGIPTFPDAGRFWQTVEKYATQPQLPASAGHRRGAHQPRGVALAPRRRRRRPLPHRRHVLADGDRRARADAAPGRHAAQAGLRDAAVLRRGAGDPGRARGGAGGRGRGLPGVQAAVARDPAHAVRRPRAAGGDVLREVPRLLRNGGRYATGDGCRRDKDGYYWITGRTDDMLNVSGHLLSTAEVESALLSHGSVAEAAVVGRPHALKGESLYCFVTLNHGLELNPSLAAELKKRVRERIGPIATPDFIQSAPSLPKTRSGKIMRRLLRKIAQDDSDFGDLSTLADPAVVQLLYSSRCVNGH